MSIDLSQLDIFCNNCESSADNHSKSEVEFYCRTCEKAICRNCLLQKHISFESDIMGNNVNQKVDIKEK